MFPKHCVKGTRETDVIQELRPLAPTDTVVSKRRYSSFFETSLESLLKHWKPRLVEVVGVCTNICVLFTVEELRNRDYDVRVYRRGVTTYDLVAHRHSLREIQRVLGARVV